MNEDIRRNSFVWLNFKISHLPQLRRKYDFIQKFFFKRMLQTSRDQTKTSWGQVIEVTNLRSIRCTDMKFFFLVSLLVDPLNGHVFERMVI